MLYTSEYIPAHVQLALHYDTEFRSLSIERYISHGSGHGNDIRTVISSQTMLHTYYLEGSARKQDTDAWGQHTDAREQHLDGKESML
jgi:hypothetical protein